MTWIQALAWFTGGYFIGIASIVGVILWFAFAAFPPEPTEG